MKTQPKILHIDFNSYFASVEQQANPFLRGKSVGVGGKPGGKGIVAAASVDAKRRGIKTAMSVFEAKREDPTLIMVDGDGRKYEESTTRFLNILERHGDKVEQFSIDEAFLDVTHAAKDWLDALAIAMRIREEIKLEIGELVTVSIGISCNKLLSKMASDVEKPNGITLVYPSEKERLEFLNNCALDDVPGIGPAILRRLKELGIETMLELREATLPYLIQYFKQYGPFLYNACRGIDTSLVSSRSEIEKSIGHSYTLPRNTSDPRVVRQTLLNLSDRVGWRLRKRGLVARSYTAIIRYDNLRVVSRQGKLPSPTNDGLELFRQALPTIESLHDNHTVRLIGIVAHSLVEEHVQKSLDRSTQKRRDMLPWLDVIQNRYGKRAWLRASTLGPALKERVSGLSFDHVD